MKALVLVGEWKPRPGYEVSPEEERTRVARQASMVWANTRLELKEVPLREPGYDEVVIK